MNSSPEHSFASRIIPHTIFFLKESPICMLLFKKKITCIQASVLALTSTLLSFRGYGILRKTVCVMLNSLQCYFSLTP